MAAHDTDDRVEIRQQNRTTPTAIGVVIVAVVAVLLVRDPSGSFRGDDVTTTRPLTEATPTTSGSTSTTAALPTGRPEPVVGIAAGEGRLLTFVTSRSTLAASETTGLRLQFGTGAIVTGDRIAVLDPDGRVVVGSHRQQFHELEACCYDRLSPSNEPGHVWARDSEHAVLVPLDGTRSPVRIDLDGEPVIGLGSFGLVTVDPDGHAVWRRPEFAPTAVEVPDGRAAGSAGGDVVAYLALDAGQAEVRRLSDGALVRSFPLESRRPARLLLSTSGDALAIGRNGETVVHDVASGAVVGSMPTDSGEIVPVGGQRFAAAIDERLVVSDGTSHAVFVPPLLIAMRAE